jgi:hypothetical protein
MNIYVLKNFTQREIYFGVCEGDTAAVVQQHKGNDLSPVGHWKWAAEEVKWGVVGADLPESVARQFLAALRREPPEDGWVQVFGGEDA